MPLLRLMEPFFFTVVKENIISVFKCCKGGDSDEQDQFDSDAAERFDTERLTAVTSESFDEQYANCDTCKPDKNKLAPAFFFLATSFNVELVYIILKSVTQFSYLNCDEFACSQAIERMQKIKCNYDDETNDCTIVLDRIKIKDVDKWQDPERLSTGMNPSLIESEEEMQQENLTMEPRVRESITLNANVKITFYRFHDFSLINADYFSNLMLLQKSLNPKYNR